MSVVPVIPDHTLLHPIGRGAYGEVWLARNVMGAPRAVKIIWRRQFDSNRPYEREFAGIQRYEPVSRTTDGLVQVLHVGQNETEGYFYCVMELADAGESEPYSPRTLRSDVKRQGRLPVADCLQVALDLVSGLARLHQHGLVHRDVKPGNIIFVNGGAKLADIGLVSVGGEARTFVGTEGYIPPEGPGTPRADIYALGMCLYEASTGYSPDRFPKVPAEWFSPEAGPQPLEFQEIVLKACEGARERRYQSAEQMRADLALLQSGQSVRRMRALERRVARLRGLGIAAVLTVVLAVGAVLFANYRTQLETESRTKELALRRRAEVAEHDARQQLYGALVREAHATVQSRELGQRVRALDAIRRAAEITNTIELQREAFAALALPDLRFERQIPADGDWTMMSLDPEFERIAVGRGSDGVEIRSVPDQRLLRTLPASTPNGATFGKWSRDGRFLGVCRPRPYHQVARDLEVWEVSSGRRLHFVLETSWDRFSFHPTKPRILCPIENGIVLYDLEDGREIKRFSAAGTAHHVEFSPDGRVFIVQHRIGGDKHRPGAQWYTSLYDVTTGATLSSVVTGWIDGMAWHPQGRWIALAARTGEVHLHDRKTGETHLLGRHKSEARTAVFSPDGDYLFTGGEEQEIICWDLRSMQRAFTIGLQSQWLQFRAAGDQCAVLTRSGVLLHRFERSLPCREMRGDLGGGVNRGVISSDGRWLAAAGTDRLGLWDLTRDAPGTLATNLFNPPTPIFTPDASELLFFWREGIVRWGISPGQAADAPPQVSPLPIYKPDIPFRHLGFSGNRLVISTFRGPLLVAWAAIESGPGELIPIINSRGTVSPNGLWMAFQNRVPPGYQFYGLDPWLEGRATRFETEVLTETFTPRCDELAVVTHTAVTFLDTNRWEVQRRFPAILDRNSQIIFMPDGKAFWLVYDARTAALHDSTTFEMLLPLPAGMLPLAVSPDGRHVAMSIEARRVQVWDLADVRKRFRELGVFWRD